MLNSNTYQYPQTNCWECTKDTNPTSINEQDLLLSQLNCNKEFNFNCNNYQINKNTEPKKNNYNTQILNTRHNSLKYLPDYHKIENNYEGKSINTYINGDPRLTHGMRTQYIMELDRPPIDSFIKMKDIYNKELENYGRNYKNVSDINAGDILYYHNNLINDKSFYPPIFDIKTSDNYTTYKDPMDNVSIQNTRIPSQNHNPTSIKEFKNKESGLSFITDTQEHRQDLLSLQYLNTIEKNSRTRR